MIQQLINKPLGVLVPEKIWKSLVEDMEALSSLSYRARIVKARLEKTTISSSKVKKLLFILTLGHRKEIYK